MNDSVDQKQISEASDTTAARHPGEFLVFELSSRRFGIEAALVRGSIHKTTIMPVPKSNGFVRGFVILGGETIPVVDLHWKLGVEEKRGNINPNAIVLVQTGHAGPGKVKGIIVDEIVEVIRFEAEQFEPLTDSTPDYIGNGSVLGVGTIKEMTVVLLDIDRLLKSGTNYPIRR
jgi:purine-binding chemotaxis protein CheW